MLAANRRVRDWAAVLLFLASLGLLAVGSAQEAGLSVTVFRLRGPFAEESPETKALQVRLRLNRALRFLSINGAAPKVFVNDVEIGPGERGLQSIRRRGGGRYRRSGEDLIFSLPRDATNSAQTELTIRYPLRSIPFGLLAPIVLTIASGTLLLLRMARKTACGHIVEGIAQRMRQIGGNPTFVRVGLRILLFGNVALLGLLVVAAAVALGYLGTTIYGVTQGYALPNTAVFSLLPWTRTLARHERALAYLILTFGVAGVWLSWASMANVALVAQQRRYDRVIASVWRWSALSIVLAAYLFSVAGPWSGVSRPGDYSAVALAGLVPFSDAGGHFAGPLLQVLHGSYDSWVGRRPVAAATRSVIAFAAAYSAVGTLLLQVILLASATTAGVLALARWRGVWASVTFFGLIYILSRPFMSTYLTEPLGIAWALVGMPLLVTALRTRSLASGMSFALVTCVSLLVRMGSMLTIPALAAWLLGRGFRRSGAASRVLVGILLVLGGSLGLNAAIRAMYVTDSAATGANFAHTLCGLAHGGTWEVCETLYASEFATARSEAEGARMRFQKALDKIRQQPSVFLSRLVAGEAYFVRHVLDVALFGYTFSVLGLPAPDWFPARIWLILAAAGTFWVLLSRPEPGERQFWVLMALGLLASAPWVVFDDGWRVLSGSFPMLALLLSCGFTAPTAQADVGRSPHGGEWRLAIVCLAMLSLLVVPGLAYRLDPFGCRELAGQPARDGEVWVLGGNRLAGILVVPDGRPLPVEIPSIHFADLKAVVDYSNVESYEKVLYGELESKEFGLVASVGSVAGPIFVTPPEVLRMRQVGAWKLTIDPSSPPAEKIERLPGSPATFRTVSVPNRRYFFFVSQAVPVRPGVT